MNHDDLISDLLVAVEQQLVSPHTPYVGKTFRRLLELGLDEQNAKHQIACCLGEQMEEVMRTKRAFDEGAYRDALLELPFDETDDGDTPTEA